MKAAAKVSVDLDAFVNRMMPIWDERLDEIANKILVLAQEKAPESEARGRKEKKSGPDDKRRSTYRTGNAKSFTVHAEMTPEGPRIAKGSRKSASASRYIKVDSSHSWAMAKFKKTDKPGIYTYKFNRRWIPGRQMLKRSGKIIPAENGIGGVRFNIYYAWYVEMGTSRTPAQPYLRPALEAYREELSTGSFLKGGSR